MRIFLVDLEIQFNWLLFLLVSLKFMLNYGILKD